jgi:EAL domain-containing protein (putative c-di-GMP-specific phosphodiesterase class I)/GGDEF domain-containing protein
MLHKLSLEWFFMQAINKYFLLADEQISSQQVANWRISALRIILTSGMLVCIAIAWHSFSAAIQFNLLYVIVLSCGFSLALIGLLLISKKYYLYCAHGLLLAIVSGSLLMNLYLIDLELAQVGSIFMYSCPIIALMLIGRRTAFAYALLNIIPFYMIINNIDISGFTGITEQLPDSNLYISGLIFVFFNVCMPLAVARTILAANRLNKSMRLANTHLKEKNELYKAFFIEGNKAKLIVDENLIITDSNLAADRLFGFKPEIKHSALALNSILPTLDPTANQVNQIISYQQRKLRINASTLMANNYRVFEFYDCTQELQMERSLASMEQENKRLRFYDPQMQLPNREWFEVQCERFIGKYRKDFLIVVTQSANIDYVNLKFAKHDSQAMLISAYNRLKNSVKGPFLCAHIGAGKLAFIMNAQQDIQNNQLLTIKSTLDAPYNVFGTKCPQAFLFGYARYPDHGLNSAKVLTNAIEALKQANKITPITSYNEKYSQEFLEKYEISMLLDEALQQGDLDVYYQPKVNVQGICVGLEALARWHSPILGEVSPGVFVPIAEEYRMVSRVTDLIIQKVCAQIQIWSKQKVPQVPVAINISLIDFSQPDFISKLVKYLADFNVKPHQIELELTETSLEANQARSLQLIQTLQSWGFTISVDDFGIGYSNIARLADYPIDKLKLDRSLISQVTNSDRQKSIVKTIHLMCKELGIKCVSEGVETKQQVAIMAQMGCKEFQGFYFARPMPATAYSKHIHTQGLQFKATNHHTS